MAAAADIGAERVIFPFSDGSLEISMKVQRMIADEIISFRPDVIITHWRGSIHRDHIAAYYNTQYAIEIAAPEYKVLQVFYGDNIEDPHEYDANVVVETDEKDEEAWGKACREYEMVRKCFYKFDYVRYYTELHILRGQLTGRMYEYGCGLMRDLGYGFFASERGGSIPGLEL